ncbi:RIP homotypic interaction motif-containing protein [Streptomyces griseorubiginosus]|uniref:RIP homotypic interaction motif-containing protein n=1 Tax=Streptomyces griseorubiginosus TaxID=67304 RepID=UPI0036EC7FA9
MAKATPLSRSTFAATAGVNPAPEPELPPVPTAASERVQERTRVEAVIVLGLRKAPRPAQSSVTAAPAHGVPGVELVQRDAVATASADPQPEGHEGVEASGPWLVLMDCQGAQVGEHNRQINVYTYRLENPEVDFAEILKRADVQEALMKVIENPDDVWLRRRAVNLVRGGSWRWHRHDVIDLGPREPGESAGESVTDLYRFASAGAVVVSNCRNVQIGDHNIQRNKHLLVYRRSSVNTVELLDKAPRIAASLVDIVTSAQPEKGMEKLRRELTSALNSQPCEPEAVAERVRRDESRIYAGEFGVSVARHRTPRQTNVARYETQLSHHDELDEVREELQEEIRARHSRDISSDRGRGGISGPGLGF